MRIKKVEGGLCMTVPPAWNLGGHVPPLDTPLQKVKCQGREAHKTVPVWVFALLWVPASSGYDSTVPRVVVMQSLERADGKDWADVWNERGIIHAAEHICHGAAPVPGQDRRDCQLRHQRTCHREGLHFLPRDAVASKGKGRKGKEEYLYSAFYILCISQSAHAWITQFYLQIHHACLSFVSVHQMAPPLTEVRDIQLQLTTHLSTPKGWKAELAWLVDL